MNIEIEIKDPLFYYINDWDMEILMLQDHQRRGKLRDNRDTFFHNNNIEIVSETQDDPITCLVKKEDIKSLLSRYSWEQTSDEYIFIYISEQLEISFNPENLNMV